jgi:periplasmic divalent cation tolerance protein
MTGHKANLEPGLSDDQDRADTGSGVVLVYSTFPNPEAAVAVGEGLIQASLAACVNILPVMQSVYVWEGKLQRDQEAVMIVKTRRELANSVMAEINMRHSYTTPAILVLPVIAGHEDYLAWIKASTRAI